MTSNWEIAHDPDEIHDLLVSSDGHQAEMTGTPVPERSRVGTERYVANQRVHLLRSDSVAAGTFTFVAVDSEVVRMGRLAVRPSLLVAGSTVGFQCVRRAIDVATVMGVSELRSEANPDLAGTYGLIQMLGFCPCGPIETSASGARAVTMALRLAQPSGATILPS